jgi:hypothetical protein
VVNSGLETQQFKIQYTDVNGETQDINYTVAAGQKLDLGYGGGSAVALDIAPIKAGSVVSVFAIAGSEVGQKINVPVLDGTLAEYQELVKQFGGDAFTPVEKVVHEEGTH